eukprot:1553913-Rhodomonas_salina.1
MERAARGDGVGGGAGHSRLASGAARVSRAPDRGPSSAAAGPVPMSATRASRRAGANGGWRDSGVGGGCAVRRRGQEALTLCSLLALAFGPASGVLLGAQQLGCAVPNQQTQIRLTSPPHPAVASGSACGETSSNPASSRPSSLLPSFKVI